MAGAPDALRVADITDLPTGHGFVYPVIALDVCSRKVVGWAMANHLYVPSWSSMRWR